MVILISSLHVFSYWDLLKITNSSYGEVRNKKQILGIKVFEPWDNNLFLHKKTRQQKGSTIYRKSEVIGILKHWYQKTRYGISLCKGYLKYFSLPLLRFSFTPLLSSNVYWRFYTKISVVLVLCFKDYLTQIPEYTGFVKLFEPCIIAKFCSRYFFFKEICQIVGSYMFFFFLSKKGHFLTL